MDIQEKIQKEIDTLCEWTDKDGRGKLAVCDHHLWDKVIWAYRHTIIDAIRKRGYDVQVSVKWGVTDILVTKKINVC